jgi:chromosome partitioning protein
MVNINLFLFRNCIILGCHLHIHPRVLIFIDITKNMTKVISFISRKGGTGKTTNAINLATMLFNLGHKLTLIETDTNFTLSTIRQMELYKTGAKDDNLFKIVGAEDEKVVEVIEDLQKSTNPDFIIVDSAGKTTDVNIKNLCMVSDAIVLPTSLTQNDLLVTFQTLEDLKPARELNEGLKIMVLPNRIHSSTRPATIKAALQELDAHILDSAIPMKNVYANYSTIMPEKEYLNPAKEIISLL